MDEKKRRLSGGGTELTEAEAEEAKRQIWKNIGRIASARPDRTLKTNIPPPPASTEPEKTKIFAPAFGREIFLEDLLKWDTSHWTDWHSPVVGFAQQKPDPAIFKDKEVQTVQISKQDVNIGSVESVSINTQTEFEYEPEEDETPTSGRTFFNKPYPPSLFAFISKVGKRMIQEIRENIRIPPDLQPAEQEKFFHKNSIPTDKDAKFEYIRSLKPTRIHRLRTKNLPPGEGNEALSVSWSPRGRQVAIGHGSFSHVGFCRHHSIPLTIWSLVEPLLKQGPLYEVRFDGCITCVQFHPKHGQYLAFGFQSGEVGMMNLNGAEERPEFDILNPEESGQRHDPARFEFKQNDIFVNTDSSAHAMHVTAIRWIHLTPKDVKSLARKNKSPLPYMVVTTSVDGYMALWSMDKSGRITLERRYAIHTRAIPDSYKKKNMSSYLWIKEIGIQTWDAFKLDPTRFVCSTYGSYLFTGNLLSKTKYTEDELCNPRINISDIYDPEPILIKQEIDYVRCIACSPFNPYLYVYGTLFGSLFIRSIKFNTGEPILKTYLEGKGTFSVGWSVRPMVFGVLNHKQAYVYDLSVHERVEVLQLDHEALCRSIDWNKEEISLVAVTDSEGYVNIWKMPEEFQSDDNQAELEALNVYAEFTEYTAPLADDDLEESLDEAKEESDELEVLDELTRNHFPILNSRIEKRRSAGVDSGSGSDDAESDHDQ